MKNDSTRQKIINATIQCIGMYGIHAVTNRLIAKSANVNCAAINYHFGTKENLINEATNCALDNYLSEFFNESAEKNKITDSQFILKRFLSESLKDAISFPRITKSFFYDSFIDDDYNSIFIEKLNEFLNRLHDNKDICISEKNTEKTKLAIIQMISSVLFIGLMPNFFKGFLDVDFSEPSTQKEFIGILINRYCNPSIDKQN